MTKKPAERFNIIIVPRGRSRIRRIQVSTGMFRALAGCCAGLALICVGILAAMLYYRGAYLETESVRLQAADFMQQRSALMGRLASLEDSLTRTERFAAKVEATAGKNRAGRVGQGPVEEVENLPDAPAATPIKLGDGLWKSPFSKSLTSGLDLTLDKLKERTDMVEEKLHASFSLQQDKTYFWSSLPHAWPTRGWVTSEFGVGRRNHMHEGIDIAGPVGTPIMAPGDGVVTYSGYRAGYGKCVVIDHGYGIATLYGHLSSTYVEEGQRVQRGLQIAAIGNTGRSTGPHLHYEVHVDGVPVNPMLYLAGKM